MNSKLPDELERRVAAGECTQEQAESFWRDRCAGFRRQHNFAPRLCGAPSSASGITDCVLFSMVPETNRTPQKRK